MNAREYLPYLLALVLAIPVPAAAQDNHYYQGDFTAAEFSERRARLFDRIGAQAIAIVQGGAPQDISTFRQSNEYYYLTGIDVPRAYLLLDGRSRRTTIYLPRRDAAREANEGKILTADDGELVARLTGADQVKAIDQLGADLAGSGLLRPPAPTIYTPLSPAETVSRDTLLAAQADAASDPFDGAPSREARFKQLLNARFPQYEVRDLSPTLDALRTIKSDAEIAVIRKATQIAGLAIIEAMRSTVPGMREYELDAAAKYIFFLNGARGEGYASIIGGGQNAWIGHYFRKTDALKDGDLLLMDYAPDYRHYTSDVTRMWPVNGRYTTEQRALNAFILAYRDALFRPIRPGVTSDFVLDAAAREMARYLAANPFANPAHQTAAEASLKFRGHFQHPVGMSVHDVGVVRGVPLQPGMIFTIDPMMWIAEEKQYVRIEDVALITPGGVENLSAFVPAELDAIERVIAEPGIVQARPASALPLR